MTSLDRPTVLVVGSGEAIAEHIAAALERSDTLVERAAAREAFEAAFAAAPDLLLLIGDAAVDHGRAVATRLAADPSTSTVPIVLLLDGHRVDEGLNAFQFGIVAVVPRSAGAEEIGRRVAELARDLPDRSGETYGEIGAASLRDVVQLFTESPRTGILSVHIGDQDGESAQVVLGRGRAPTDAAAELTERVKALRERRAGPLRYEFHESPTSRIARLPPIDHELATDDVVRGLRVVVIAKDPVRSDALIAELGLGGAIVVGTAATMIGLERAGAHHPELVVLDDAAGEGWAMPVLRMLRRDTRLRWASLVVANAAELFPTSARAPDMARLLAAVKPMLDPDRELTRRAMSEPAFDVRLELVGPSRLLRALAQVPHAIAITIVHTRARIEIDLANGRLAGARAFNPSSNLELAAGASAISTALALRSARVHIERASGPPRAANVMKTVDEALAAAVVAVSAIADSMPPPSMPMPIVPKPGGALKKKTSAPGVSLPKPAGVPKPSGAGLPLRSPARPRIDTAPGVAMPEDVAPPPNLAKKLEVKTAPGVAPPPEKPKVEEKPVKPVRPNVSVPSQRATTVMGTVSKNVAKSASDPPPPIAPAQVIVPSKQPTQVMSAVVAREKQRSEPPPMPDEEEPPPLELDAVAVPGKLTPPPSLGATFVPKKVPSGHFPLVREEEKESEERPEPPEPRAPEVPLPSIMIDASLEPQPPPAPAPAPAPVQRAPWHPSSKDGALAAAGQAHRVVKRPEEVISSNRALIIAGALVLAGLLLLGGTIVIAILA